MFILLNYIIVNLVWGLEPLVNKYILKHINIYTLMLIISIIYLVFLLFFAYRNKNILKKDLIKIKNYKLLLLFILFASLSLMTANYGFLYLVNNQNAAIVSILTAIYPIITLIVGYKYFNETLTKYQLIGFILVLLGIFFINYKNQ